MPDTDMDWTFVMIDDSAEESRTVLRAKSGVPHNIFDAIDRYVNEGYMPGSFTRAVLENDLMTAFAHGDQESIAALPAITRLNWNNIPTPA